ncbi:MAG: bifunctional adenosylcobinamide kinase/adenosylcobinamide-phosphate guanylyltransferase [Salinivirgaceae bacterium]|nr:bifunctional adenosylcobinamide kinase/adenosylcobinamide-phosphate guanylyltransferase [Salinivirgaceae bacterium]
MTKITFITGGARSGKSSFAQKLAEELSASPVYLATARIWDKDFQKRVNRHKAERGEHWQTIEEEKQLSTLILHDKTVVLDCITLWLTNIFHDNKYHVEKSLAEAKKEWDKFVRNDFQLLVVSNELGMGVHPEHESARKFIDLQGWMNQYIANTAHIVYLMVSGLPVKIK